MPRAATLESLLRQNQVQADVASSAVGAVQGIFNPKHLKADRSYRLVRTLDGLFREFQYQIDAEKFLRIVFKNRPYGRRRRSSTWRSCRIRNRSRSDAITAEISKEHSSLIGALNAIGENVQLALSLAEIFGGEVDFNSELQRGDRFTLLFERIMRDGQFAGYGDIQGAILETGKRRLTGVRFLGADGKPAWYDEQGRSLKREFLKSPLPFEPRITSRFSAAPAAPDFRQRARASGRGLRGADRHAGDFGRGRASWKPPVGTARPAAW